MEVLFLESFFEKDEAVGFEVDLAALDIDQAMDGFERSLGNADGGKEFLLVF